jgi:hypothetical protein
MEEAGYFLMAAEWQRPLELSAQCQAKAGTREEARLA